jgi:hypothetical protein
VSRWYDVTFRRLFGDAEVTNRSSGNTRGSAEARSRRKLRDRGLDSKEHVTVSVDYAPDGRPRIEDR